MRYPPSASILCQHHRKAGAHRLFDLRLGRRARRRINSAHLQSDRARHRRHLPGRPRPRWHRKSELAINWAHGHRDRYRLIWWVTAESPAQITDGLAALAAILCLPITSRAPASTPPPGPPSGSRPTLSGCSSLTTSMTPSTQHRCSRNSLAAPSSSPAVTRPGATTAAPPCPCTSSIVSQPRA